MSNGGGDNPRFVIHAEEDVQLKRLRWKAYPASQCDPWTYYATANLHILSQNARQLPSSRLLFRLDTAAFLSVIPNKWLTTAPWNLHRILGPLSSNTIKVTTIAGTQTGQVVRDVPVRFIDDRTCYSFDFLVSPGLDNRGYGLISLRDVVRHFAIETTGELRFAPDGTPVHLPHLQLRPLASGVQVLYRCPHCGIEVRGRPGMHLTCGDGNVSLVRPPGF